MSERPDVCGMVLNDLKFESIIAIGEAKGEDKIKDTYAVLCDLMKIACFSKNPIEINP